MDFAEGLLQFFFDEWFEFGQVDPVASYPLLGGKEDMGQRHSRAAESDRLKANPVPFATDLLGVEPGQSKVAEVLDRRGYKTEDVENVMYRNWQRFFERWLPEAA